MIRKAFDNQIDSIYLSETVVVGSDFHRRDGKQSSVVFIDRNVGLEKVIVDSTGKIRNFPGIIKESFWYNEVSAQRLQPRVFFRLSFEKRDNMWVVFWTVQPDGRYWADDDGFGAEKEEEIVVAEIEGLIEERQAARKEKNFARADEIRDILLEKGIELKDTREGVKWQRI